MAREFGFFQWWATASAGRIQGVLNEVEKERNWISFFLWNFIPPRGRGGSWYEKIGNYLTLRIWNEILNEQKTYHLVRHLRIPHPDLDSPRLNWSHFGRNSLLVGKAFNGWMIWDDRPPFFPPCYGTHAESSDYFPYRFGESLPVRSVILAVRRGHWDQRTLYDFVWLASTETMVGQRFFHWRWNRAGRGYKWRTDVWNLSVNGGDWDAIPRPSTVQGMEISTALLEHSHQQLHV